MPKSTVRNYVLMVGFMIKSACEESDTAFFDSDWGAYLTDMFEVYMTMQQKKRGTQDVKVSESKGKSWL